MRTNDHSVGPHGRLGASRTPSSGRRNCHHKRLQKRSVMKGSIRTNEGVRLSSKIDPPRTSASTGNNESPEGCSDMRVQLQPPRNSYMPFVNR